MKGSSHRFFRSLPGSIDRSLNARRAAQTLQKCNHYFVCITLFHAIDHDSFYVIIAIYCWRA